MQTSYATASNGKGRRKNGPRFERVDSKLAMGNHGSLPNMQTSYATAPQCDDGQGPAAPIRIVYVASMNIE